MSVAAYLRKQEWSMGNGQCPSCCGVPPSWHGHPCHMTPDTIGHNRDCDLAAAIVAAGEVPLFVGDYKSDAEFEPFISESGLFGTRRKTAEGCPRYRAYADRFRRDLDESILRAVRGLKV